MSAAQPLRYGNSEWRCRQGLLCAAGAQDQAGENVVITPSSDRRLTPKSRRLDISGSFFVRGPKATASSNKLKVGRFPIRLIQHK
jgi:hypothetical protein